MEPEHSIKANSTGDTPTTPSAPLQHSEHHLRRIRTNKQLARSLVIAIGLLVAGFGIFAMLHKEAPKESSTSQGNHGPAQQQQQGNFLSQYKDTCKDRKVSFTASPIPLAQLGYIEPMGKVSDGHVTPTDHAYLSPKNQQVADNTTDVVMPADGTVVEIGAMPAEYIGDRQQQTAPEDHRMVVSFNCQYFAIFIHIHKLSPALANAVGSLEPNTQKRISVDLKAGDLLGKIGGNPVDYSLIDTKHTLAGFVSPELYRSESWKVNVIDPLSVYTGSLKNALQDASLRTTAPFGGKIDYDKKGALVGNWFRTGTNGYAGADQSRYWDGHLSIAPDYIDGKTAIVSIGNWKGKAAQFAVKGSFDPSTITKASGLVKAELISLSYNLPSGSPKISPIGVKGMTVSQSGATAGTIVFKVLDNDNIQVEKFIGKMPAEVSGFSSAMQTYER